jgi:hypothetical protein
MNERVETVDGFDATRIHGTGAVEQKYTIHLGYSSWFVFMSNGLRPANKSPDLTLKIKCHFPPGALELLDDHTLRD